MNLGSLFCPKFASISSARSNEEINREQKRIKEQLKSIGEEVIADTLTNIDDNVTNVLFYEESF